MNISVALIIHLVFGYRVQKETGINSFMASHERQIGISLNFTNNMFIHAITILATVGCDT